MPLLAEQLVDEWLNRKGFFTIRGVRQGVDEIDLLGIRSQQGRLEGWHVEVQASFRPIGYISPLTREGMEELDVSSARSVKRRSTELLRRCASQWVNRKFKTDRKRRMREGCWKGLEWKFVLVHGIAKYADELGFIRDCGIETMPFHNVLQDLEGTDRQMVGAAGTDISDLMSYFIASKANISTDMA